MTFSMRYINYLLTLLIFLCGASINTYALSPAEAAKMAAQQSGGKVLKVEAKDNDSYKVRTLLPNGRIKNININKNTKKKNEK